MATIPCTDVADSAQFVAELRGWKELRCFVASLLELLRKARPPFWEKQRWRIQSPELRMQLLLQNDQCAFAAPPGDDQEFLFCAAQKGVVCYERSKRWGCGCSVDACGGSIVDMNSKYDSLCSLSLHGSEGRSSKVLVADATSSAPVGSSSTIQAVSAGETDVEVVMSVSGAMRALVLFCNAVGVKPSPFVAEDFAKLARRRPASPPPWPPWLGDLPPAVTDQKSVTSCLHLPSRHRHSFMLGQRRPNKLWIRWGWRWHKARLLLRRTVIGAQSVVKTMELLVGNLSNSCSCYTWQSPTNCHSTFAPALVTLKSAHVALGRLKQKFSWTI